MASSTTAVPGLFSIVAVFNCTLEHKEDPGYADRG